MPRKELRQVEVLLCKHMLKDIGDAGIVVALRCPKCSYISYGRVKRTKQKDYVYEDTGLYEKICPSCRKEKFLAIHACVVCSGMVGNLADPQMHTPCEFKKMADEKLKFRSLQDLML